MEEEAVHVVVLQDPVPALRKLVEQKRGRPESKGEGLVNIEPRLL